MNPTLNMKMEMEPQEIPVQPELFMVLSDGETFCRITGCKMILIEGSALEDLEKDGTLDLAIKEIANGVGDPKLGCVLIAYE